jgi:phage recombination protein Bet
MSNALQTLSNTLATRLGMGEVGEQAIFTLKNTAFKGANQVTDAQMVALLIVANQYGLNPFTRELYAFPDKGGIVPIVSVDGWARIINEHPMFDGMDFDQTDDFCTCIMYRKDRSHPVKVTEWMSECKRDNAQPWKTHPKRMLRHKSLIQCARLAFGFVGIYDQDEAERIIEAEPEMEVRPGKRVATPKLDDRMEEITQEIQRLLDDNDISVNNEWVSLTEEEQDIVNRCLTSEQKKTLKSINFQVYLISVSDYINSCDTLGKFDNYIESLPELVVKKVQLTIDNKKLALENG